MHGVCPDWKMECYSMECKRRKWLRFYLNYVSLIYSVLSSVSMENFIYLFKLRKNFCLAKRFLSRPEIERISFSLKIAWLIISVLSFWNFKLVAKQFYWVFLLVSPREKKVFPGNFVFRIYFHFWTFHSLPLSESKLLVVWYAEFHAFKAKENKTILAFMWKIKPKGKKIFIKELYKKRTFNDFGWTCLSYLFICWAKPLFKVEFKEVKRGREKAHKFTLSTKAKEKYQRRSKKFFSRLLLFYWHS